ncbi:NAD(P)H-hydrate dehydratase [Aquincola sp. MAHUQ-54]|uniref:Bifunctional NAD(P)H-hydrate repair enzyme n=1 Tax=Aquincola agrisoli TaxID=3119538 RepID=A0AAW9QN51_9BURK
MPAGIHRVLPPARSLELFDTPSVRRAEAAAQATLAPHTLMRRAGLAVARLALATHPHGQAIGVLAGPGNNGGDGLEAAMHLVQAGRRVTVHLLADPLQLPADAAQSLQRAREAGAPVYTTLPSRIEADLLIDALLGLGLRRAPEGNIAEAIRLSHRFAGPVLAVDIPSGLHAETGARVGSEAVRATHTLSLLALKPGLFTGEGRELSGDIWHDSLGVDPGGTETPIARLNGVDGLFRHDRPLRHSQHKGSFGDVVVIGGATGMAGAARLAGRGALAAGGGRVYLSPLDLDAGGDDARPELMHRPAAWAPPQQLLSHATVACGCGGGQAVAAVLDATLLGAPRLVLDADALNSVAASPALQTALAQRARHGQPTVLTPHPLEAARLLDCDTQAVQADRLRAAMHLATRFGATVVLKGSGTVLAAPGRLPCINPTGNALLATAGTGDVLAGWIAGSWAQMPQDTGWAAATATVWLHGLAADEAAASGQRGPLRAADLIEAMHRLS